MDAEPRHSTTKPLRLATTVRGSGPAIVFVHGVDDDSSCWEAVVRRLPDHLCVTADLPGHGRSPVPADADAYRREPVLDALDSVLNEHEAEILVGHSLGGYLGLAHVITRPGVLKGLVLVAAGPGFRDEESRQRWNERVLTNASRYRVPEIAARIALHEDSLVMDRLEEIRVPVALVVGSDDSGFIGANDYMERKLANVTRTTVEGARHFVMRTNPDEVATAVRAVTQRTH